MERSGRVQVDFNVSWRRVCLFEDGKYYGLYDKVLM